MDVKYKTCMAVGQQLCHSSFYGNRKKVIQAVVALAVLFSIVAVAVLCCRQIVAFEVVEFPIAMEGQIQMDESHNEKDNVWKIKMNFVRQIVELRLRSRKGRSAKDDVIDETIVIEDLGKGVQYIIINQRKDRKWPVRCFKQAINASSEILKKIIKSGLLIAPRSGGGAAGNVQTRDKLLIATANAKVIIRHLNSADLAMMNPSNHTCYDLTGNQTINDTFYESDQMNLDLQTNDGAHIKQMHREMHAYVMTQVNGNSRDRRGIVDYFNQWQYGNWCGKKIGGYNNNACASKGKCKAPYESVSAECLACHPPVDGLDRDCMEHDRCLKEAGPGPSACVPQGNRCKCDYNLAWGAFRRWKHCLAKGDQSCALASAQMGSLFTGVLSCWFPTEICYPSLRFECDCTLCACPKVEMKWQCLSIRFCVPLGSGKINR